MTARGDFINGTFLPPTGDLLRSCNPALDDAVVLETAVDPDRIALACDAAQAAQRDWAGRGLDDRHSALEQFRLALASRSEEIASAIREEMGKLKTEAEGEVRALIGRFASVYGQIRQDLIEGPLAGHSQEWLRYQPHGVVGVIGPYNYPLHLCHAHAIPALLAGNTVVIKPSEVTPLAAQRYAEAAEEAGLPPGVLNLVQGTGASGRALVEHQAVRGLCFTGSYATGRRILETALDRPELLVALEMGGKNTAVVLQDADLRQAAHEIMVGGYLTTGQRCTCTDRVLVQRDLADPLVALLKELVEGIRFGDPTDRKNFAGPMATQGARDRYLGRLADAERQGAVCVARGDADRGGAFVTPSLHRLDSAVREIPGYTDEELFGPDLCVQVVEDLEEAASVLNASHYGLTNSIFAQGRDQFEWLYRNTRSGILNWNRTTNQASPRLPFGGVGRSGNFRPAGAHAARNVVFPVAIQAHPFGIIQPHAHLEAKLPGPDLDQLERQHLREEQEEMEQNLVDHPRPMGVRLPQGGTLPRSSAWLDRLYAGGRMVKEKKPCVFDHRRSFGPWMVSVDEQPMSVLDGMSQTATLPAGFGADVVVRPYHEGAFGDSWWSSPDTSYGQNKDVDAYRSTLLEILPGMTHVSFANSGAEANEKALALCQLNAAQPDARRILAFKGSFHGRTMLSLHATWNPKKRGPYELEGYEARFADFPARYDDRSQEPSAPEGFLEAVARGQLADLAKKMSVHGDDLLMCEIDSLSQVDEQLRTGEIFACVIEPMQSEGGDRYATARFYQALRLLTRHHDVSLVMDEVQTGMGLGITTFWYTRFDMVDAEGKPDAPDAVTVAKRAQVGVCASHFEDPAPTSSHPASLIRGRLHAEFVANDPHVARVAALIRPRLEEVAARYPELVGDPRADGYAFAFDVPTPEHMKAYLGQRFWRGCVVFGAGTRTIRYRLSSAFDARSLDLLFTAVRRSLSWLDAHPGQTPPTWEDAVSPVRDPSAVRLSIVRDQDPDTILDAIMELEQRVYEPARRDSRDHLGKALLQEDGVAVLAEVEDGGRWKLIGSALGAPLELFAGIEGPGGDPNLGKTNSMYSIAITVDPDAQGLGLGRRLKQAQLRAARGMTTPDGAPRYRFVTGRNRVGLANAMTHLNRAFGAYEVARFEGQYGDPGAQAIYYRLGLQGAVPDVDTTDPGLIDLSGSVAQPLSQPPDSLRKLWNAGALFGPTVNKITICNYVSPAIVRAVEWVGALRPDLPHLYLTSCRDETIDKSLRVLRTHRGQARVAIGLEGGYVGHTTAAARSLSDPSTHLQGAPFFDWPRVPHPADVGTQATLDALDETVGDCGGAEFVLGFVLEFLQERTGRVVPEDFWALLDGWRGRTGIPVVLVENASNSYRTGAGVFGSTSVDFKPDLLTWWAGGQVGFIHVSSDLFVSTPLTMVSTWDGDELSMIRVHHRLRALRSMDVGASIRALDGILQPLAGKVPVCGQGLHRILDVGGQSAAVADRLHQQGIRLQVLPTGKIVVAPCVDLPVDALETMVSEICSLV